MYNATSKQIPGKKGAITRLVILSIISVIAILSSFGTIPQYAARRGVGLAILEAFGGCGILFLLAAFFWGLFKWISVVAPKSFGLAKRFWMGWYPLTFFGLYIKACIWLLIAIVPCAVFGLLFSPLFSVTLHFAKVDIDFFSAMALFFLSGAAVLAMGFVDVCKLRQRSAFAVVKQMLSKKVSAA